MWRKIALGTIIAGSLDITEVMIFYELYRGVRPVRILQSIAAGLIGRGEAFEGGIATAVLGLGIHFCIAFVVVTIYHLAARRLRVLVNRPIVMGALYGLAVYAAMTFLVLPLTATGAGAPRMGPWPVTLNVMLAHVFCVGIPAALTARYSSSSSPSPSTPALLYFLVLL
ncbi:MAG TPA: hypothetical protein VEU30_04095 [Thermoanaerobaculia bacterium]|nr:hypothetical protein [Thermoanaerobaculia bacterium]